MIRVQYFARYREVLGVEHEQVSGEFATLQALREHLLARGGVWQVLDEASLMCACNQEMCSLRQPLQAGDEVAFFPAVTGG